MHRSGTSAVTGALGHLGLSLPAPNDLVSGRPDNPIHYESQALTDVDDALLRAWGGSWSAPPSLPPDWERLGHDARDRRPGPHRGRHGVSRRRPPCLEGPPALSSAAVLAIGAELNPCCRSSCGAPRWPWPGRCGPGRASPSATAWRCGTPTSEARWPPWRAPRSSWCGSKISSKAPEAPIESVARWLDSLGGLPRSPSEQDLELAAQAVSGRHVSQGDDGELPDGFGAMVETLQSLTGPHDEASGGDVARSSSVGARRNLAAPRSRGHLRQVPAVREVA